MRTTGVVCRRVLFATGLVAASIAGPLSGVAAADDGGRPLSVKMTGAAEAPGPGDPDGSGTAFFRVKPGQETICYVLTVEDIASATAAHIHRAPAGSPGPVVVPLVPPTEGSSAACAEVDRALAVEIVSEPEAFYVNVHNAEFPAGAVRGQLGS